MELLLPAFCKIYTEPSIEKKPRTYGKTRYSNAGKIKGVAKRLLYSHGFVKVKRLKRRKKKPLFKRRIERLTPGQSCLLGVLYTIADSSVQRSECHGYLTEGYRVIRSEDLKIWKTFAMVSSPFLSSS